MGIINQNYDISEKKMSESVSFGAIATGATNLLCVIPYDAILQGGNLAAFGLSGSPVYSLSVFRCVAAGQTSIGLGVTFAAQAFGTSGPTGFSVAQPGISLIAGDVLCMTSGVANTAVSSACVNVVYSGLADIKVFVNAP